MTDRPHILLAHHLKALKLPTFLREYEKVARQCAAEGLDHVQFLARLVELELIDRERRMVERRIKAAKFPVAKSLDSFRLQGHPRAEQGAGAGVGALRVDRAGARTSLPSALPAPARPMSPWGSGWPPAKGASLRASPRPPRSCTS